MRRLVADIVFAVTAGSVAANAVVHLGAARAQRRDRTMRVRDDEPIPWVARTLSGFGAFLFECVATACLVLTLPLLLRPPAAARRGRDAGRPVVLLAGGVQHPLTFLWLVRRLRRDGWQPLARVVPAWGGIDERAAALGRTIAAIRRRAGTATVDLVAHGRGGLVARAYLRSAGPPSGVARLITVGTPHQGTEALPWGALRPGSPFLVRLAADDPVPALVEAVAIHSRQDAAVAPKARAYYPGAFNIEVGGPGHLALLVSRRVYALVRENLAAETSPAVSPAASDAGRA
jgi:pimeloyl-ACP methyl ester carboxylesterase